ncbi:MAG TPA: GNAT family N-acetyltransferase [Saliniramus sp.]|nr:GNAT family N-acetyltransferase [Saliniramus sp.]
MIDARSLTIADLPGCLALSAEAGWNQTEADWRTILAIGEARGLFVGDQQIASAAVIPYGGRFGWICMVLVTKPEQRKGHATRLLRWAMERLGEMQLVPGLDATPAGREVYRQLGFADIYGVTRLNAPKGGVIDGEAVKGVSLLSAADMAAVTAYDAPIFGADRSLLLGSLRERMPHLAFAVLKDGVCRGYVLAREGRNATQVGPLVADDMQVARTLLSAALSKIDGPVFIDLADRHAEIRDRLEQIGFTVQRPFTRMLAGRSEPLDDPPRIVALTGPEFA